MSDELKPCPMPGCDSDVALRNGSWLGWYVVCDAGHEGPSGLTEAKAVERWNARELEDTLRAEIETLKSERAAWAGLAAHLDGEEDHLGDTIVTLRAELAEARGQRDELRQAIAFVVNAAQPATPFLYTISRPKLDGLAALVITQAPTPDDAPDSAEGGR